MIALLSHQHQTAPVEQHAVRIGRGRVPREHHVGRAEVAMHDSPSAKKGSVLRTRKARLCCVVRLFSGPAGAGSRAWPAERHRLHKFVQINTLNKNHSPIPM